MSDFTGWLGGRLAELNTDESVFLPYILSILEGEDETEEEKCEAGLQERRVRNGDRNVIAL